MLTAGYAMRAAAQEPAKDSKSADAKAADAAKADLPVGAPIAGAELAAMINEIAASATPDTIAAYRRLAAAK